MTPHSNAEPWQCTRTFSGYGLRTIAFPVGGIGTGTVSVGGRGNLQDWEILNHPGKGANIPLSFFAIWCKPEGCEPVTRVLEGRLLAPHHHAHGLSPGFLGGLPRLEKCEFRGEYPFAWVSLSDPRLPVSMELRAWNPMIPLDADDSGIPIAFFDWTAENVSDRPVQIAVAFCVLNPLGWDGSQPIGSRRESYLCGNLNDTRLEDGLAGVAMTGTALPSDDIRHGSMAIASASPDSSSHHRWRRGAWFDDSQWFWNHFSVDGRLPDMPDDGPSPAGESDIATVISRATILSRGSRTLPFTLGWSFPNLTNTWNTEAAVRGKSLGNYYATKFPDAWSAVSYANKERGRLESLTVQFHRCLFNSTVPPEILDAVSANAGIVRTTTVMRTADGRMNAFEGCSDGSGCCPMNCTHVWNYAQSVAALYPSLERSVRQTDFSSNTDINGDMAFRTLLPLLGDRWAFRAAADGQMGSILRLYREWVNCGDDEWLRELWPSAKRALEFAWSPHNPDGWDADKDGVMEGIQHNTYDIEFLGPNSMMGAWYLAALRAAAEMAEAMGEAKCATEYRALAERGADGHDALWNGEYYQQSVRFEPAAQTELLTRHVGLTPVEDGEPHYQYGSGCLSDQLTGQWFAHCVGLGHVLPPDKVHDAAASIFRLNFREDLSEHASCQRVYALNDESGLLMCSWPHGGKPRFPFPYADEVWTGIEYQVAALLIFEGMVDDGLRIVRAARTRHNGANRNPWDECECGHHYARAMSSWSLLTAYAGFRYDARGQSIRFEPVAEGDFRCFFVAGTAWGEYSIRAGERSLEVCYGDLALARWSAATGVARVNGTKVTCVRRGDDTEFDPPIVLRSGDNLTLG